MADETITVKLYRYDPSVDLAPTYKTYEVPWEEDMTGLMVLHYINENIEEIGFDYCCRSSLCGRCSCLIDGKPGLACWRFISQEEHTFEPLPGFPVIRDLVVDHSAIMKKMVDTGLVVQRVEPITAPEGNIPYETYMNVIEPLNMCKECMSCYAACPVLQEENKWESFIGPAAMAQIALRNLDPMDEADRVSQAVFSGLWDCTLCGECAKVCPSYIPHTQLFTDLQKEAEERGLKPAA